MALSEGNIGAVTVLTRLLKDGSKHDPQAFDPIVNLMDLDALGVYGSRIWLFYKDVCGENLGKMIACMRAWQLGKITEQKLLESIGTEETRGNNKAIDVDSLVAQVKAELSDFNVDGVVS